MNDINVAFYAKVKTKFYCHPAPDFYQVSTGISNIKIYKFTKVWGWAAVKF